MADREEQYVLRFQDKAVAARIKKLLNTESSKHKLGVRFDRECTVFSLCGHIILICMFGSVLAGKLFLLLTVLACWRSFQERGKNRHFHSRLRHFSRDSA